MTKFARSDDDLRAAVLKSISYRQVLRLLGMYDRGGNYRTLKRRLAGLPDCDTSHFLGRSHGTSVPTNKLCLEDVLVEESHVNSVTLKRLLLSAGLLKNECENGHPPVWMGARLVLHLDHKNGINTDNRLENLRLLCPNCHAQTETYCRGTRRKATVQCLDCDRRISRGVRCHKCDSARQRTNKFKIRWPAALRLEEMVKESSFRAVGLSLGVSDVAVRKHLFAEGIRLRKYRLRV